MSLAPWHEAIWAGLRQRLERDQLPHAILLAGAAGLGKRELATQLTAAALCSDPVKGDACGKCRSCRFLRAGTHPDLHPLNLELNTQGNLRKEIVVAQVRELSRTLSMTSQLGGRQIAVIDPADQMNRPAANALLKTLEEPARDTIMVLIADQPWRLPATVRSRCQAFTLHTPSRELALQWLQQQSIDAAESALDAAGGNPGLALDWHRQGLLALHQEVHADLRALARHETAPLAVSERWADEQATQRLWFAARAAAGEMKQRVRDASGQSDSALDDIALLDWYRKAIKAREDLRGPLRPVLVLFPLLAAWR